MALIWTDKVDGQDDVLAADINAIAREVIRLAGANSIVSSMLTNGSVTPEKLSQTYARQADVGDKNNLITEHKNNLVEAINEAAQSGGSVEIPDNTITKAKLVSALRTQIDETCQLAERQFFALQAFSSAIADGYVPIKSQLYRIGPSYQIQGGALIPSNSVLLCSGYYNESLANVGDDYKVVEQDTLYIRGYEFFVLSGLVDISGKQDKTAINLLPIPTTASITMKSNTETRFLGLKSLTLTLPNTLPDDYISSVVFTSSSTATVFIPPTGAISFVGEDCTNGTFTPVPNKRYTVILTYDGAIVRGDVGGVSTE